MVVTPRFSPEQLGTPAFDKDSIARLRTRRIKTMEDIITARELPFEGILPRRTIWAIGRRN